MHRREFITKVGGGFTHLALAGLLAKEGFFPSKAAAVQIPRSPNFHQPARSQNPPTSPAKAKNVIFLFMYGGPSHMDTFDYKPDLYPLDGKTIDIKTFGRGGKTKPESRRRTEVEFQAVRPVRKVRLRPFPPRGHLRR